MPIGRPRRNSIHIRVTLTFDPVLDEDLIRWFFSIPRGRRAGAIKAALQGHRPELGADARVAGEDADMEEDELALDL